MNALGHRSEVSYETAPGCAVAQSSGAGLAGRTRTPNDLVSGTSSERCYDVFGRLVRESGPANLSMATWSYVDTPLAVAKTESHAASASGTRATTTRYDGFGRAVEVTRTGPGGQTVFDSTVRYDAMGRVVAETQPAFGAPGPATFYAYDPLDRVVSATLPGSGSRVHRRRYDRGLVEKIDPRGEVVRVRHDALGRIVRVEEVAGSETWLSVYEHDASDQLTRITDHHGNATTVEYDRVGRRIRIADPDIGHRDLGYDTNGNVVSEQASGHETIFWTYDKIGRPLKKRGTSPRGWKKSKITWRYDTAPNGIGLLESRSDDDSQVQRVLQYDLLGRPTHEAVDPGAGEAAPLLRVREQLRPARPARHAHASHRHRAAIRARCARLPDEHHVGGEHARRRGDHVDGRRPRRDVACARRRRRHHDLRRTNTSLQRRGDRRGGSRAARGPGLHLRRRRPDHGHLRRRW